MKTTTKIVALMVLALMIGVPAFYAVSVNLNVNAASTSTCTTSPATAWVVDTANNRIMEFVAPFSQPGAGLFSPGMGATVVIGQSNFLTGSYGTTASSLKSPSSAAFDSSGNLWVADTANSRVLEFAAPFTDGMSASVVIGQSSFTAYQGSTSQTGLNEPQGIAFDSKGNLWVADTVNNRILEFKGPSFTNHQGASSVIGQTSYTSSTSSKFSGVSASTFNTPIGIAFDSKGNLWVADSADNRVLEFLNGTSGISNTASLAIGQANMNSNTAATSQTGLSGPGYLSFDPSGNLWVSDLGNGRVIEYTAPFVSGMAASAVLGTSSSYTTVVKNVAENALNEPMGISFDTAGNLWIADSANNRVLEVTTPIWSGSAASLEIGQSNFDESVLATSQYGFDDPTNIVVTGEGTVCTMARASVTGNVLSSSNSPASVTVTVSPVGSYAGYIITIVSGDCAGETNVVVSNSGSTLDVSASWSCSPDTTSTYQLSRPVCSTVGPLSYTLAWVKNVDPNHQSTMFVLSVPQDAYASHAFTVLSSLPAIYVIRLSDGAVLYQSQGYNVRGSQYGILPNQQFTLSGVGVPVTTVGNSYDVVWLTTSAAAPDTSWLHVAQLPVNQGGSVGPTLYQPIPLDNLVDPATGTTLSLNPVSVALSPDGAWIIVGATAGYIAAFSRSC